LLVEQDPGWRSSAAGALLPAVAPLFPAFAFEFALVQFFGELCDHDVRLCGPLRSVGKLFA